MPSRIIALDPNTYPQYDAYTGKHLPNCSRPINYGIKANTLSIEFDSGHTQRRIKSLPKKTFDINYLLLLHTEYLTIMDFFTYTLNVKSFYWTDPVTLITYKVMFNQDTFSAEYKGNSPKGPTYSLSLKLVQSWD